MFFSTDGNSARPCQNDSEEVDDRVMINKCQLKPDIDNISFNSILSTLTQPELLGCVCSLMGFLTKFVPRVFIQFCRKSFYNCITRS